MQPKSYTLAELARELEAELEGDPEYRITGINALKQAGPCEAAFIANSRFRTQLADSRAGVVILKADWRSETATNKLVMDNPYLGFARLTQLFDSRRPALPGVHPSVQIGADTRVPESACIGANVVLGEDVVLGENVVIGANTVVGDGSAIGDRTELRANVTVYHGVTIGRDGIVHSGAVIGADGFGFAPDQNQWHKIHQLGGVVIGDRVEIGACTTIDRGALGDTEIADGVKIDNLVMIAHNVRVGKNTAIAGQVGIAGSSTVGENCTIAGQVGIAGHVSIADGVHFTGKSLVSGDVSEPGAYSSGTPLAPTTEWRRNAVRFRQLDALAARVKKLEKHSKTD
ncbi:UDP-3-O-(3-hydroxymyristoyl)glucosamine N-acyltransferase [Marinimicrobium alkaliphilum]|uniref:UDP-3-O-(3-hydroxymyristoyl)glucosamine N-acyltransferase n=1 Tax=Marinimicrobium alkaliphilum TaxID=2202654 RepID=UPI000DB9B80E|nr:UDP-3-O-(3-hydroxymyristoyl)glucosamine N-acyltransferase [Marinimicrobium alkaliphilum]